MRSRRVMTTGRLIFTPSHLFGRIHPNEQYTQTRVIPSRADGEGPHSRRTRHAKPHSRYTKINLPNFSTRELCELTAPAGSLGALRQPRDDNLFLAGDVIEMRTSFRDRTEAGRLLANKLRAYERHPDAIVLALPRGGVPVAYEVAIGLGLPLDVFVVRKLGVPGYRELAMGAIASGGVRVLNEDVLRVMPDASAMVAQVTTQETQELERRERDYRGDRPPRDIARAHGDFGR